MEELLEETQREEHIMKIKTKIKVLEDEIKVIKKRIEPQDCGHLHTTVAVSYTHLTLPTIYSV